MTPACDPQHAFSRIWRVLDLFNSFLRLFEGLMVKYSQISSSSREFKKNSQIFNFNFIDIWGFLKSFLQMAQDLKVIFRSKKSERISEFDYEIGTLYNFLRSKNYKCSPNHKCQNHNFWFAHPIWSITRVGTNIQIFPEISPIYQ